MTNNEILSFYEENGYYVENIFPTEVMDEYREEGLGYGFLEVISGPMVRSSYRAERALDFNNAGL